jgi:hypothetical protein
MTGELNGAVFIQESWTCYSDVWLAVEESRQDMIQSAVLTSQSGFSNAT